MPVEVPAKTGCAAGGVLCIEFTRFRGGGGNDHRPEVAHMADALNLFVIGLSVGE